MTSSQCLTDCGQTITTTTTCYKRNNFNKNNNSSDKCHDDDQKVCKKYNYCYFKLINLYNWKI